jgi:hypothetical protein
MSRFSPALPLAAWLGSTTLFVAAPFLRQHLSANATLPLVSLADSGGDVVSSVEGLVIVLIWAFLSALIVEPAKFVSLVYFARRGGAVYLLLLFYQIILIADTVHAHAIDWWIWLLSLVKIGHRLTSREIHPVLSSRFPWVSLGMAFLVGGIWYWLSPARGRRDE